MSWTCMTLRPMPASLAWNAGAASLRLQFDFDFARSQPWVPLKCQSWEGLASFFDCSSCVVNYLVVLLVFSE